MGKYCDKTRRIVLWPTILPEETAMLDLFIGIRGTKAVGKIVTSDSFSSESMVYSSHQFFLQKIYPYTFLLSSTSKDYSAFVLLSTKLGKRFIWNLVKLVNPVKMSIYEDILCLIFQDGNLYRPRISNTTEMKM